MIASARLVRPLLALVLLLSSGLPPAHAEQSTRGRDGDRHPRIVKLLRRIEQKRDATPPITYYAIARLATREAMEALFQAVEWLEDADALEVAYDALSWFRDDGELAGEVVLFLEERALRGPSARAREVALPPLVAFGERAHPSLRRILAESRDAACRTWAVAPLVPELCAAGTEEALRTVLDNAAAAAVNVTPSPLLAFAAELRGPLLRRKLKDRRTDVGWRLFLVELLADDPHEELQPILEKLLKHDAAVLQVAALRALEARGVLAESRVQLERMRRAPDPRLRVEVVPILSRLRRDDVEWRSSLETLARQSRHEDRITAVRGLAALGRAPALLAMLGDRHWKVRAAVLAGMCAVRDPSFLAPLLERLDAETGRLRVDVVRTLENLTGLRLGQSAERWRHWYAENGEGFVPPSVASLPATRLEEAREGETVGSFYGLPVHSRRATFVLDVSGSMSQLVDASERTRLDDARRRMAAIVEHLPAESRCNFVYFNDEVQVWSRGLRAMDEDARQEAMEFGRQQEAWGGTNLYGALVAALEDEDVDTLYVLSDGAPTVGEITDPHWIRREVQLACAVGLVRIHGVALGEPSALLEDLARDSGGRYVVVGAR